MAGLPGNTGSSAFFFGVQGKANGGAGVLPAADMNGMTMCFNNVLTNGQSQSTTRSLLTAALIGAEETLKGVPIRTAILVSWHLAKT